MQRIADTMAELSQRCSPNARHAVILALHPFRWALMRETRSATLLEYFPHRHRYSVRLHFIVAESSMGKETADKQRPQLILSHHSNGQRSLLDDSSSLPTSTASWRCDTIRDFNEALR